jgi:hypothetical protein
MNNTNNKVTQDQPNNTVTLVCIFSQKENCLGFPDENEHPACNCIMIFNQPLTGNGKNKHYGY